MRYFLLTDGEPGGYGVSFPDLPGCVAMGETLEEALINASQSLSDWVGSSRVLGRAVPAPRDLARLRQDPEVAEALADGAALASLSLIEQSGKPVRANLSLDSGVLAAIDDTADRLGLTRSGLIERLARQGLPLAG